MNYSKKRKKRGYVVAVAQGSTFYVDGVSHIERDDACIPPVYEDDESASAAAEAEGIKLIRNMDGVMDGIYLDTPENRTLLRQAISDGCSYDSLIR